jgi:hypothetical protein
VRLWATCTCYGDMLPVFTTHRTVGIGRPRVGWLPCPGRAEGTESSRLATAWSATERCESTTSTEHGTE